MLRLMENTKALGFKIESTPYAAETLTSAEYDQRIFDLKITKEIESYARKLMTGDYSRHVSISGRRKCTCSFSVNMYPGSTVATAPKYFEMIQACGWKQITWGATGVSVSPHADYNRVPATIEVAYTEEGLTPRQLVIKMKGAMGKFTLESAQVGQPIKLNFEFQGVLDSVSTRAYASRIVPTAFDTSLPPALLAATFSFVSTWQFPTKFTIDSGEDVQIFSDLSQSSGYHGARVVDRNMTGSTDPDMVVTDDLDLYTEQINNSTSQLSITIGGAVPQFITAPAVQIVQGNPEAREGHIANNLNLEFKRGSNGNDECEILQGSKT